MINSWYWLVGIIIFLIIEGCTYQLVCIWFALGSLASMITSVIGGNFTTQFTIFIAVSLISLVATRPIINKMLKNRPHEKTNADRLEGCTGIVTETINPLSSSGQVKVNGSVWSAKNSSNEIIDKGSLITVKGIEGVKVLVERKDCE